MPKFIGEVGVKRLWNKISEQFVQKEVGKGLLENNFSDEYKTELDVGDRIDIKYKTGSHTHYCYPKQLLILNQPIIQNYSLIQNNMQYN